MNSVIERVITPREAANLETSVKHYNNFSPMFRGPATSNTLLSISKNWLNKKLLTKGNKKFKTFLKGAQSAREAIRAKLKKPFRVTRAFSPGFQEGKIPTLIPKKSTLNHKFDPECLRRPSKKPTLINLPMCESKNSRRISRNQDKTPVSNLELGQSSTFEPKNDHLTFQSEPNLNLETENTYEILEAICQVPFSTGFKGIYLQTLAN